MLIVKCIFGCIKKKKKWERKKAYSNKLPCYVIQVNLDFVQWFFAGDSDRMTERLKHSDIEFKFLPKIWDTLAIDISLGVTKILSLIFQQNSSTMII